MPKIGDTVTQISRIDGKPITLEWTGSGWVPAKSLSGRPLPPDRTSGFREPLSGSRIDSVTTQQNKDDLLLVGNNNTPTNPNEQVRKPGSIKKLVFPINLEDTGIPYMLINIYKTVTTNFPNQPGQTGNTQEQREQLAANRSQLTIDAGKLVDKVRSGVDAVVNDTVGNAAASGFNKLLNLLGVDNGAAQIKDAFQSYTTMRNIDQLDTSIALFMPDGLAANYDHNYDELSMTALFGGPGLLAQAMSSETGEVSVKNSALVEGLARAISDKIPGLNASDELTNLLVFGATGRTVNPQLELLYGSPRLRTFTFDFRLIPRSAAEARRIDEILYLLKYHSAPEIPQGTSGRFMIPPSQFEIEFYSRNGLNNYLFKTKKCVLEGLSLDYSPNGFASFYDGHPVETRLQLTFKETSIVDKQWINKEVGV